MNQIRYWGLWLELLKLSWRTVPGLTAGAFAIEALMVGLSIGFAVLLRAVVDAIADGRSQAAVLVAGAAAIACTAILIVNRLHGLVALFQVVGKVGPIHVERRITEEIAGLESIEHMEHPEYLNRIGILRGSSWSLVAGMWTAIRSLFTVLQIALCLWLLGTVSAMLLVLLVLALAPLWADNRARRVVNTAQIKTAENFRLQRELFELATDAGAAKEIRVAGAAQELRRLQATAWDDVLDGRFRAQWTGAIWKGLGWSIFALGFAGLLGALVLQEVGSGASPGDLVLVVTLAVTLQQTIQSGVSQASSVLSAGQFIEPYLWLRDYAAQKEPADSDTALVPDELSQGIELRHVSYTYPGAAQTAISDVNVVLPAGSVIAVVGEFGSGKTTLVKLLSRFYRPVSGSILVNGTDIADFDAVAWRRRTSAAYQDFGRYPHLSFIEAVGLGDIDHRDDADRLEAAVQSAGAEGFSNRLPQGQHTVLGKTFGGIDLSEGQWQKTALARASMRPEPLVFILDEPTASLDAPSEKEVFDRYMVRAKALAGSCGAITVVVSHRFATVTGADLILVMERGRVVESGSHEELMALGGTYRELFAIQESAYQTNVGQ